MALTTIPSELSSVSGIADSSDATAITIDSSENVILSSNLTMPGGSNITWGTSYPALGNILNSQATILGNNIKAGATNNTVVRHANGTDAANFIALTYNQGVTFHTGITTTQNSDVAETTNERVRIDTTGNVGIGVTPKTWHSGWEALQIGERAAFFSQASTTTGIGENIYYNSGWKAIATAAGSLYQQDSGNHHFYTQASVSAGAAASPNEKFTIKNDGKVGIGETSPTRIFVVKRSDAAGTVAEFENTGTSTYIQFTCNSQADNAAGYVGYNSDKDLSFWTDDVQRLTIDEIGSVGIKRAPENAYSAYTSIEFGQEGAIFGNSTNSHVNLAQNVYLDGNGNWKAKNTNASCLLQMQNGEFQLYNGAQVSADATVSWLQRLVVSTAGALLPGGDSTQNLGSTSKRWDNLYVNDMHFSNEGSDGNDVDGTTGDWTLQEGEEHLYIINNKSGKKFKFSLEEIE